MIANVKHNNHPRRSSARRNSLVHELLEGRRLLTTITSVVPLPNSHVELSTGTILATFDAEIDPNSVSAESFAVHGTQTGPLVRPRIVTGREVSVSPEPGFHAGELVHVTATDDIMDVEGETVTDSFVWQFRAATSDSTGVLRNDGRSLGQGSSYDVSVGDIDGDGDLDAVVANYHWLGYGGAKVWINVGNGTFSDRRQSLGSGGRAVELGDLDGDGDLDAVVGSRSNQVWINDGTGTFEPSHHRLGGRIHEMALGDLDVDGDLDMIVSPGNSIWLNNGNATFEEGGQILGTFRSVALGDLDNDGDLDAFLGGNRASEDGSSRADQLWLNDGNGRFNTSGQSLVSSDSSDIVIASGQNTRPNVLVSVGSFLA